jgi:hypothetical protein
MTRILLLALPLVAAGCWNSAAHHAPPARGPGRSAAVRQSGSMLGSKVVSGKDEPNKLIAADGSTCIVPTKQFGETVIGTSTICLWEKK